MRSRLPDVMEAGRLTSGKLASDASFGPHGAFCLAGPRGNVLRIIASDGHDSLSQGWEHVSVSLMTRCPFWDEMAWVKEMFFEDDETVLQFHPAKSKHINCHPFCLHLWRHKGGHKLPPAILVGPEGAAQAIPLKGDIA